MNLDDILIRMEIRQRRPPQPEDQDNINRAIGLVHELVDINPHIEGAIWSAALLSMIVFGYK